MSQDGRPSHHATRTTGRIRNSEFGIRNAARPPRAPSSSGAASFGACERREPRSGSLPHVGLRRDNLELEPRSGNSISGFRFRCGGAQPRSGDICISRGVSPGNLGVKKGKAPEGRSGFALWASPWQGTAAERRHMLSPGREPRVLGRKKGKAPEGRQMCRPLARAPLAPE